jgi:hypothetical protein
MLQPRKQLAFPVSQLQLKVDLFGPSPFPQTSMVWTVAFEADFNARRMGAF